MGPLRKAVWCHPPGLLQPAAHWLDVQELLADDRLNCRLGASCRRRAGRPQRSEDRTGPASSGAGRRLRLTQREETHHGSHMRGQMHAHSVTTVCNTVSASPSIRVVTSNPPGTSSAQRRRRMAVHAPGFQNPAR